MGEQDFEGFRGRRKNLVVKVDTVVFSKLFNYKRIDQRALSSSGNLNE